MPIAILNPACPHADPIVPGIDQRNLNASTCGRCICVPRYWQILATPGVIADDTTKAFFGRPFALNRSLSRFSNSLDTHCLWSAAVALDGEPAANWSFYYGSIAPPGGGLATSGWLAVAHTADAAPAFDSLAAYVIADLDTPSRFNCLDRNTLTYVPGPVSYGFPGAPATITIQPFWP